ncbi:MAG: gamma-glutamylcyclotransferase [Pseudomonadota bacterium]
MTRKGVGTLSKSDNETERWVFGYGSLMWRPGFDHLERRHARIDGVCRSLCVLSHVHRGTPERPGLVLGLDAGGACEGVAFRVALEDWPDVLAYLRAREQVTGVYLERSHPIMLMSEEPTRPGCEGAEQRQVEALCYVVDQTHVQYAGSLTTSKMVDIVMGAIGQSGPNPDYVLNTVAHLAEMDVHDPDLFELADRIRSHPAHAGT